VSGSTPFPDRAYAKRLAGLGAKVAVADLNTKASTREPALLRNAVAPIMKQQWSEKIITVRFGRRGRTLRRWRLCPLRGSKGRYRPLHAVFGAGSRDIRDHGELHRFRRDRDRADYRGGYSRQHSEQPGSGRTGRPSAARDGRGFRSSSLLLTCPIM
jgi:hypothetical protein